MIDDITRRDAVKMLLATGAGAVAASCTPNTEKESPPPMSNAILSIAPLGFQWETQDPFIFCVHHDDRYPEGNEHLGPAASLAGRRLGNDFEPKDGWRMYHGTQVPGFPQHPHRGFETVTVVRRGLLDHSDSLGAAARYGGGDVQWLTAGSGIIHAEMFPLLKRDAPNPLELFQIWVNLPRSNKMVAPHFSMLWDQSIPKLTLHDEQKRETNVAVIAGRLGDTTAPPPPPNSWASMTNSDVAIWTIKLSPQATFNLPPANTGTNRTLYFFKGSGLTLSGRAIPSYHAVKLRGDQSVDLVNGSDESELLLLQGKPINEPMVQHGPFVMNSRDEIIQAFNDYQRTQFGGWPWQSDDPVHPITEGRFARFSDGRIERPV